MKKIFLILITILFTSNVFAIPTVTVAFSTAGAITAHDAANCDGKAVMYATPPDATITIQGQ